ncbi:deoxyribodipyrimidine photo-lyase [bacterium SCSIO 12696]|nr:deoxyribodipyrimidine photo-lyase [bacterium SCSIO 12696]
MTDDLAIIWFRQDLRLSDNPALALAAQHKRVLPIYILDEGSAGEYAMGGASRWWLHHSLTSLNESLQGNLSVYCGDPAIIIGELVKRLGVTAVYWNRCYEPWRTTRDADIKQQLSNSGVAVKSSNGSLLWEPWQVHKNDGGHYKVFTPFYRKGCLQAQPPRAPLKAPRGVHYLSDIEGVSGIGDLNLLPNIPWDAAFYDQWRIGEDHAQIVFEQFIENGLHDYKEGRNFPEKNCVSRLSPYLHFGEISPNQLWHTVRRLGDNPNIDHFCSELGWREFSYSQLYHNPTLPKQNLQSKFDRFPWADQPDRLNAWQVGLTGIPMVDAGMRELWQTGYMHNRVRMIVGSFLVKNLRLHWHHGERWFWDTLLDADLANNSASWQWIAGCGADAAPYFRIFNPVTQGQKFDPDGSYVRRYIPEIASLPDKYLFSPWEAPEQVLLDAKINLGTTYPKPVVDLKQSRVEALEAFKSLSTDSTGE